MHFAITFKYFAVLLSLFIIVACEREHLQPNVPGEPDPLVYFLGRIGNDSVRIAGGIDSYVGSTTITDTLTHRTFQFALKNIHNPLLPSIRISINNYQVHLGEVQSDLDHTIFPDGRHYQDNHNFIPLAVTIEWFDNNGTKYSSKPLNQGHPFSLESVDEVTHEGKSYKKATVVFECNLSDALGHIVHLTNGRAVILFGTD